MIAQPIQLLDALLPDNVILRDMRAILQEPPTNVIELDSGVIKLPEDPEMQIVTKTFFVKYYSEVVRHSYWVEVAIGQVRQQVPRTLKAEYCFSTLWYNANGELVSSDFHREMR